MKKIAFITGASSGFGEASARVFARQGWSLIINARREAALAALKNELENEFGIKCLVLAFDVRDRKQVETTISAMPEEWKQIDLLLNNAGLAVGRDLIDEGKVDDWERMIDTNLKGLLYVTHALLPFMTARKQGHVINLGSVAGKDMYERGNVYCATKSAIDALSHCMRIDLLRHGIKVTAIHPGAANTEFALVRFKGDHQAADNTYKGIVPLTAEDVAEVIYYTASLPAHVCINDLVLTCLQQADGIYIHRN